MVTEVLMQTEGRNSHLETHPAEVEECEEHLVPLLPARGATIPSYSAYETHKWRTPQGLEIIHTRCNPVGLTGSLRIGPTREYSHPREVQTREEEDQHPARHHKIHCCFNSVVSSRLKLTTYQPRYHPVRKRTFGHFKDVALARARPLHPKRRGPPHEHRPFLHPFTGRFTAILAPSSGSTEERRPAFGRDRTLLKGREPITSLNGQRWPRKGSHPNLVNNMCSNNNKKNGDLPPLPHRAIWGLPSGSTWDSPDGSPFHTVRLWEFTNLYVQLGKKDWQSLSTYLKRVNLRALSRKVDIGYDALLNIRVNSEQSILVPKLRKLCDEAELKHESVEKSIRGVRFNKRGSIERLKFPFVMNIYAWRILCHIVGDGNINKRKYPALRWIQLPDNQEPMRKILHRLSRVTGGKRDQIWYPKALTYAMIGTMPGLTISDLKSPKFLQFIIDLPPEYRDWKVQFLAAFIVDDGSISKDISFTQKDPITLNYIIKLCDQLGYDHSSLYRHKRDVVHNFQLRQIGIQNFYIDVNKLMSKDPLLGLWHKSSSLQSVATSFSMQRGFDNRYSIEVYTTIISILGDHQIHSTNDLRQHPLLKYLLEGKPWYYLNRRLEYLHTHGFIQEVMRSKNHSFNPKHWVIPTNINPETVIQDFLSFYGDRAHPQSYKRRFISRAFVIKIKAELANEGIEPTRKNVARRGGFSKGVLYRDDLRDLFEDLEEDEEE